VSVFQFQLSKRSDKQTYFGALDYKTKEFLTYGAKTGNSENTINFLEYLRSQRPDAKLLIIWDGASYHRSQQIKDYLDSLNANLEKEQWLITCVHICPKCTSTEPCGRYLVARKKTDSRVLFFLSFLLCCQGFI
jgi:putative transposase